MAWEKRGTRKYYYRSVRRNGQVRKLYYGASAVGKLAAEVDSLRRAEQQAARESRRAHNDKLKVALDLIRKLNQDCDVFTAAALLAAGYHRPSWHSWRRWRNARNALAQTT